MIGEIKNANQFIGLTLNAISILICLFINKSKKDYSRDWLMLLLLLISVGLLLGYLFWGSNQSEGYQWGYMVFTIITLIFIFLRLRNNLNTNNSNTNTNYTNYKNG
jgi:hypothetical protein